MSNVNSAQSCQATPFLNTTRDLVFSEDHDDHDDFEVSNATESRNDDTGGDSDDENKDEDEEMMDVDLLDNATVTLKREI